MRRMNPREVFSFHLNKMNRTSYARKVTMITI